MMVYLRNVAVLSGAALALGSATAQTTDEAKPARKAKAAAAAAAPAPEKFSGPREKLVVAMP